MEIFLRLYAFITKAVNFLLTPIFYIVFELFGKHDKLPPLKSPLLEICAVDLAEKIRNREVNEQFVNIKWFTMIFTVRARDKCHWMQLLHTHDLRQGIPHIRVVVLWDANEKRKNVRNRAEVYWPQNRYAKILRYSFCRRQKNGIKCLGGFV